MDKLTLERWIIALFSLNALDAVITVVGIAFFGAIEINPVMAFVLCGGPLGFVAVKLLIGFGACHGLAHRFNRVPRPVAVIAVVSTLALLLVCTWNVSLLIYTATVM